MLLQVACPTRANPEADYTSNLDEVCNSRAIFSIIALESWDRVQPSREYIVDTELRKCHDATVDDDAALDQWGPICVYSAEARSLLHVCYSG